MSRFPGLFLLALASVWASASFMPTAATGATSADNDNQAGRPLRSYTAEYHARSHGMTSTATRSLSSKANGLFELEQGLSVSLLGANVISIRETSQFHVQDQQAIPSGYWYRQRGFGGRREHLGFDWDKGVVTYTRDGRDQQIELNGRVLDPLGFSVQLSLDVRHAMQGDLDGSGANTSGEFEYDIADSDRIVSHLYRIIGEEILETDAGSLATVKLERVREPDSPRSTTIWLARDKDYILARLEQVSGGGARTELQLLNVKWSGD